MMSKRLRQKTPTYERSSHWYRHLVTQNPRTTVRCYSADGLLHGVRRAPSKRHDSGSDRSESSWSARSAATDRGCTEVALERGLHTGPRKQILLLACTRLRDGAFDHGAGRCSFWQHMVWAANGSRQRRRRGALGLRRFIAWGVWNCFARLVLYFQLPVFGRVPPGSPVI